MAALFRNPRVPALLVVLLLTAACATTERSSGNRDRDVLTRSELAKHPNYSALQMIRQFRPLWLKDRNADFNALGIQDIANPRGIRVYFDGINQRSGVAALDRLAVSEIHRMRKLDASDATQRFGIGHSAGAILVDLARGSGDA